jgi:hypothetical protein
MKSTLLEIVQSILSDMDSEEVNSIDDTLEALQVASIVKDTYNAMVVAKEIPEHRGLLKLTALGDSDYPTHFEYPTDTSQFESIWYNVSTSGSVEYREIKFLEPLDFLEATDNNDDNTTQVLDKNGGTTLFIRNDRMPNYYTSFDDHYIVMDSHDNTIDTTLQASKTRAYGISYPSFSIEDTFTPDLDAEMFPLLLAESKSACFSLLKVQPDPKVEQRARRLRSYLQNDRFKTKKGTSLSGYGR